MPMLWHDTHTVIHHFLLWLDTFGQAYYTWFTGSFRCCRLVEDVFAYSQISVHGPRLSRATTRYHFLNVAPFPVWLRPPIILSNFDRTHAMLTLCSCLCPTQRSKRAHRRRECLGEGERWQRVREGERLCVEEQAKKGKSREGMSNVWFSE
ncbi:hypothetical protein BJV78DRAFT_224239 [Lactifluus subvellereus]|nr:hypothetical protein BJV78DRAFT_224239 [Lactifluus subvellereus]